ncbi:acyltransferase family protein [Agriterribacter humi]|uniref:acyltransferase family protein n=1 Tax=Agriterribacter humi TaxID=1104781 RepID=UPI0012655935
MKESITKKLYYPALDGLRGIAILSVILFHNFEYTNAFSLGWLGVDLFFVISGFLITTILLQTINNRYYFRNFYIKRILRIFPLFYVSLILILYLLPLLLSEYSDKIFYYKHYQLWFWTFLQNWLLGLNFPNENTSPIIQHFWSLAVEEQFYLIWPLLIFWIKNPKTLCLLIITLLLGVNILRASLLLLHLNTIPFGTIFPFTRIDGICSGSLLALILYLKLKIKIKHFIIIGSIILSLNFLFYIIYPHYMLNLIYFSCIGYTSFSLLFSIIIYLLLNKNSYFINIVLENRIIKLIGKVSFGLYIIHYPVYILMGYHLQEWARLSGMPNHLILAITSVITTIIGIILSIFSYYCFEIHFLRLKKKFS